MNTKLLGVMFHLQNINYIYIHTPSSSQIHWYFQMEATILIFLTKAVEPKSTNPPASITRVSVNRASAMQMY